MNENPSRQPGQSGDSACRHEHDDAPCISAQPRFFIRTLGCKVNQAESEKIASAFEQAGWIQTGSDSADVCIVNTCTVTAEADTKNRKVIRQLLRATDGPLIVTGCAVNVGADFYRSLDERVLVERDKERVFAIASRLLSIDRSISNNRHSADAQKRKDAHTPQLREHALAGSRTRASVKVQDGCDNSCSFCIVHTTRGPARSVPAAHVVDEVNTRFANAPELVLVGIDLAAYDDGANDLASLLRVLQKSTDVGRIRITSVEPQSLTPSLVDVLAASNGRVCRHVHLCLQSGSTKVLQEMNRHYTSKDFELYVQELKERVPSIALSTDVIVGFPGETDEDFEQTMQLVKRCGFMRLHVFRYSKRSGTPAAARADQVPPEVMATRSKRLIELGEACATADMNSRIGTCEFVVVEGPHTGTSESYHTVHFDESLPQGSLIEMEFTRTQGNALFGTPV